AEIGCGAGDVLHALAARFPRSRFTGIDAGVARPARQRAASRRSHRAGRPTPTIRRADARTIANDRYDVVLSIEALHEMEGADEIARAVRESLTDRGVLIVIEPCLADDDPLVRKYLTSLSALYCIRSAPGALGAAADE